MLEGKHIVLGVTGSIAAYKTASLASMLKKQHADVTVIMTKNATNIINPITFEELTGNKCLVDTKFSEGHESQFHISGVDIIIIESFLVEVIRTDCAGEETLIYHRGELSLHFTLGSDPCALERLHLRVGKIGRASCRERVYPVV